MMALAIIVVVVLLAFGGMPSSPEKSDDYGGKKLGEPGEQGQGGAGFDASKLGEVGAGVVSLGGTVIAALGGGGAATGATGAGAVATSGGGIASGGQIVTTGAAVTGEAGVSTVDAFATVSGVSTGLEAGIGTSPLLLGVAIMVISSAIVELVNEGAAYANAVEMNKRRNFFGGWWAYENQAVDAYLEKLSESRGGAPAGVTRDYARYVDDVDVGGFNFGSTYYVNHVDDPQVTADLPTLRAAARWWALLSDSYANLARANFWTACGKLPPEGKWDGGIFDQNGTPALRDADFWVLANQYLKLQPFAQVRFIPTGVSAGATRGAALLGTYRQESYQPLGLLPEDEWGKLDARVMRELGGTLYASLKKEAEIQGYANGMTICAKTGWQLFYPGDYAFAEGLTDRAGVNWPVMNIRIASNQIWACAIEQTTGAAFNASETRRTGRPVLYRKSEWV